MRAAAALVVTGSALTFAAEGPIQDNSFLVEEAYNQEPGVVQHISTYTRTLGDDGDDWLYSFTQEWPVGSQRHQLGFTFAWLEPTALAGDGVGDFAVNWRYQLSGSGSTPVAFAPRVSLLLPLGDEREERGTGALGVQGNLPLSVVLGERWVTHVNLGATYVPRAKSPLGDSADLTAYHAGQSVVWLAHPRVNALLELSWISGENVTGPDTTERFESLLLSPGVRWSHDFDSGLQIVPGIAVPCGIGPSSGVQSVFLYLSFEHPFGSGPR